MYRVGVIGRDEKKCKRRKIGPEKRRDQKQMTTPAKKNKKQNDPKD
jgi:hypothetical protein